MTRLSVLLAPGVFPPDSGGPATFAPDIGRSLVERGHAVRVVTNGTAPEGFDDRYPFDVVRIRRGESVPSRYARQVWTLIREIRSFDPDVLLANAFDLQAMSAARLTGTPAATKVVGDNAWERARRGGLDDDIETFQRRSYGPKVRGLKALRTFQTRLADRVVTPSEYLRDVVTGWGVPRERTEVIYNAIELDAPDVARPDREARIVTVGRLVPWKGVDGLLEAFGRADLPDAEFHVVGDGPERETLEQQADRVGVADRTVFHGRVPHERVLELVAGSRVFALNSTYEGLPHVVLEAMACGTPVVASAAGGTPEAVADGQSGVLVEQGDADGFASAFESLFGDDEQWEHLRQGGFDRLEKRFDHESMVDAYEDLLGELA